MSDWAFAKAGRQEMLAAVRNKRRGEKKRVSQAFLRWRYGDEEPDPDDFEREHAEEAFGAGVAAEREKWTEAIRRVKNHYQLKCDPHSYDDEATYRTVTEVLALLSAAIKEAGNE